MYKGCKFRIYPTKEQEKILFIYCKYFHIMRNFLVGKFKDNLPKMNCYGIKGYKEKELIEDFGEVELPLLRRLYRGVICNYKISLERYYKKICNSKLPKFHKFNPNKQSFYLSTQEWKIKEAIPIPHHRKFSVSGKSKIK